jgi:hypothetical protein
VLLPLLDVLRRLRLLTGLLLLLLLLELSARPSIPSLLGLLLRLRVLLTVSVSAGSCALDAAEEHRTLSAPAAAGPALHRSFPAGK